MTAPAQLNPAVPLPGLVLAPLETDPPLVADLLARIGAPYGWKSARRTDEEWTAWFARCPARMFWLLSFEGEPAGIASYDLRSGDDGDEVEIETFGLLPDFVGKGLGGYALTLAIQRAWQLSPAVSRIWLHTSTMDHPHALPNYHRRGFRTFNTKEADPD